MAISDEEKSALSALAQAAVQAYPSDSEQNKRKQTELFRTKVVAEVKSNVLSEISALGEHVIATQIVSAAKIVETNGRFLAAIMPKVPRASALQMLEELAVPTDYYQSQLPLGIPYFDKLQDPDELSGAFSKLLGPLSEREALVAENRALCTALNIILIRAIAMGQSEDKLAELAKAAISLLNLSMLLKEPHFKLELDWLVSNAATEADDNRMLLVFDILTLALSTPQGDWLRWDNKRLDAKAMADREQKAKDFFSDPYGAMEGSQAEIDKNLAAAAQFLEAANKKVDALIAAHVDHLRQKTAYQIAQQISTNLVADLAANQSQSSTVNALQNLTDQLYRLPPVMWPWLMTEIGNVLIETADPGAVMNQTAGAAVQAANTPPELVLKLVTAIIDKTPQAAYYLADVLMQFLAQDAAIKVLVSTAYFPSYQLTLNAKQYDISDAFYNVGMKLKAAMDNDPASHADTPVRTFLDSFKAIPILNQRLTSTALTVMIGGALTAGAVAAAPVMATVGLTYIAENALLVGAAGTALTATAAAAVAEVPFVNPFRRSETPLNALPSVAGISRAEGETIERRYLSMADQFSLYLTLLITLQQQTANKATSVVTHPVSTPANAPQDSATREATPATDDANATLLAQDNGASSSYLDTLGAVASSAGNTALAWWEYGKAAVLSQAKESQNTHMHRE